MGVERAWQPGRLAATRIGETMKIFISHARRDKEWAKGLVKELEAKGIHPWLDEYELRPGESWEDQIRMAVADSDTLVAILGEGQPSPNVLVTGQ